MSRIGREPDCEHCLVEPADIFTGGEWLCADCEYEAANDKPLLSALEAASLAWRCDARIIG